MVGVWYLMGWLHHLTKDADSARFYLEQMLVVREVLASYPGSLIIAGYEAREVYAHYFN